MPRQALGRRAENWRDAMRKKLCVLGLLALLFCDPAAADILTDDQLLYKFTFHTRDVYLGES